jgi:hypothetical protein
MLMQGAFLIVAVIAVVVATAFLGTVALYVLLIAGVFLGMVLACGTVTSFLLHWPWPF